MPSTKARFYHRENQKIRCRVCAHNCLLGEGQMGLCGARRVEGGELCLLNYGVCVAAAVDPVEKKPLYHFYPGSDIFSLGTWGCNFQCPFCQNWALARGDYSRGGEKFTPEEILSRLQKLRKDNCIGIAYTYNEPAIWFEFLHDTARLAKQNGYVNALVTNGYLSSEALEELSPYLDALNVDVKAFSEEFYRNYCRGRLNAVKETVERCAGRFHLEITYLVIPTLNDSRKEVSQLVNWIAGLNPDIPLHFSRYVPGYRLNLPPTPVKTLDELRCLAMEKLNYVYLGNVPGHPAANTWCPSCQALLIERKGFGAVMRNLEDRRCSSCGEEIALAGTENQEPGIRNYQ